jgi:hypothetical protein
MATSFEEAMARAVCEEEAEQQANGESPPADRVPSRILSWLLIVVVANLCLGSVVWGVNYARRAREVATAQDNFKKVALALIDYADQHPQNQMPTQAIYDRATGKPLLSWRVAILPQLGESALHEQIRLSEPWDSPHNQQFWGQMPKVYELPGLPASEGLTAIQVFTGSETPFQGTKGIQFPSGFTDGPASTILIAEAARAVNWMRPEDLDRKDFNPDNVHASLGARTSKGALVGLGDGSVRGLPSDISNRVLRAAITPASGDIIGGCCGGNPGPNSGGSPRRSR